MTQGILDWPENESDLPSWLDSLLVGPSLRTLVQQLEVLQESNSRYNADSYHSRLESVLGDHLPDLLEGGLVGLDKPSFEKLKNALLNEPRLLLGLQERILLDGTGYWDRVQQQIGQFGETPRLVKTSPVSTPSEPTAVTKVRSEVRRPLQIDRRWYVGLAALAATVLLGLFLWEGERSNGKFFARRGLLDEALPSEEFLSRLSSAIRQDWANDEDGFGMKLRTLRDSCDTLLASNLSQLSDTARTDLRQRCKKWRKNLSEYIEQLESFGETDELRSRADATVEQLAAAIEKMS